ncbi:MAG: uracil-DNA glycosylase family protein, partial [Planctomycetota bacterium]
MEAEQIQEEVGALAAHLQRIGIRWLPKPQPESVAKLSAEIVGAVEELPASSPDLSSAPPASPTVPAGPPSTTSRSEEPRNRPPSVRPANRLASVASVEVSIESYPGASLSSDDRSSALQQLQLEVAECTRCETLYSCRKTTVFGEGASSPRFVFFGEGPGADEDRTGRPFVGRAGQLLTKMIEACTL